ncbi:MAG: chemoreceptor glutamine deamidase CheD [Gammaproteobacteria bacterium]|nr:MAG: chemoreceptor glutamine deamidase CheD [Gammaproteobacteria bacterium]
MAPSSSHVPEVYYDSRFKRTVHKLLPGQYTVVSGRDMIMTLLGSCVSVCIRDKNLGIGGMNHFMLAEDNRENNSNWIEMYDMSSTRYGSNAMELLINGLIKKGGNKNHFEAKIFGGASLISNISLIGSKNIALAKEYLKCENISLANSDVGGKFPRKIFFIPETGDVYVKKITSSETGIILEQEEKYSKNIKTDNAEGDIYFFD